jgi:hypothetical protein
MKPYGVPRDLDVEFPGVGDIKHYGLCFRSGGKDYFKNKAAKSSTRRHWKRRARAEGKKEIRENS